MTRILHVADMHLDSSFAARLDTKSAQLRRSEQRAVFSKIIKLAQDSADVLLISGDLFDSENISDETVNFLKRKFAEIPNTAIFIAAGNHDPYTPNSVYARESFGSNVKVFGTDGEYVDIDKLKIRICGVSFGSEDGGDVPNILSMPKNKEYTNIAVVHGNVRGGVSEDKYNPIALADIENSGFDYVALGHVHTFSGINKSGKTFWAYPGIPEPRGFDECAENGRCGVILTDCSADGLKFEFKEVYERRYHELEIEIESDVNDSETIVERILQRLSDFSSSDLFKVIISGQTAGGFKPNIELINSRIKDKAFFISAYDKMEVYRDLTAGDSDGSLRAVYIRMLNKRIENAADEREKKIAEAALKIGIDALDGRL